MVCFEDCPAQPRQPCTACREKATQRQPTVYRLENDVTPPAVPCPLRHPDPLSPYAFYHNNKQRVKSVYFFIRKLLDRVGRVA